MPNFKLIYFDGRGRAEFARLIFAQAGKDYEDCRVSHEYDYKTSTPFGQLPVLEVDGQQIAQTLAICRYLARLFGLAGNNPIEEAQAESIVDSMNDCFNQSYEFYCVAYGFHQGNKDELYEKDVVPAMAKYIPALEKFLAKSGSGFLVGKTMTWADLCVTEFLETISDLTPKNIYEGHPKLKEYVDGIRNQPNIRKWLEKRPKTNF